MVVDYYIELVLECLIETEDFEMPVVEPGVGVIVGWAAWVGCCEIPEALPILKRWMFACLSCVFIIVYWQFLLLFLISFHLLSV